MTDRHFHSVMAALIAVSFTAAGRSPLVAVFVATFFADGLAVASQILLSLLWRPVRSPNGGWGIRMLCLRPTYLRTFLTYAPPADKPWPLWRVVLFGWLTVRWADLRSWARWAWTWRARERARAERMRRAVEREGAP